MQAQDEPVQPPSTRNQLQAGQAPTDMPPPANVGCQEVFCLPFPTKALAEADRKDNAESILESLPKKVVPLYRQFIYGGTQQSEDISTTFAKDFTQASETNATTHALENAVAAAVKANPPTFPPGATSVTLNLADVLKNNLHALVRKNLIFSPTYDPPFLLAGGIATEPGQQQKSHRVGAKPSNQNDDRRAEGTVTVTQNNGVLSIAPIDVMYTVDDTIDFCPGACGGFLAQRLTVPLSRWEATGSSGDVPFTVKFPGPVGSADSEE